MHQRVNARSSCRSAITFCQLAQFSLGHNEFRRATIHADNQLGECPDDGFVEAFHSGRADAHLRNELLLVDGSTRLASHIQLPRQVSRPQRPRAGIEFLSIHSGVSNRLKLASHKSIPYEFAMLKSHVFKTAVKTRSDLRSPHDRTDRPQNKKRLTRIPIGREVSRGCRNTILQSIREIRSQQPVRVSLVPRCACRPSLETYMLFIITAVRSSALGAF